MRSHLDGEKSASYFTLFAFLVFFDCTCSVELLHYAKNWSAVCYCGIFWPYSLTYFIEGEKLFLSLLNRACTARICNLQYTQKSHKLKNDSNRSTKIVPYLYPYKPSVLFMGHWQTVQNEIRRYRMWRLTKFFTVQRMYFLNLTILRRYFFCWAFMCFFSILCCCAFYARLFTCAL